jgi:hypothetical protein
MMRRNGTFALLCALCVLCGERGARTRPPGSGAIALSPLQSTINSVLQEYSLKKAFLWLCS